MTAGRCTGLLEPGGLCPWVPGRDACRAWAWSYRSGCVRARAGALAPGAKKARKSGAHTFVAAASLRGCCPLFSGAVAAQHALGGGGGEAGASGLSRTLRDHTFLRFAHPRGEGATTPHGAARGKCGRFYAVLSGGGGSALRPEPPETASARTRNWETAR